MKAKGLIVVVVFLGIFALMVGAILMRSTKTDTVPEGYTKVETFVYRQDGRKICPEQIAECGVCHGRVINQECYVNKNDLTDIKLLQMGLSR